MFKGILGCNQPEVAKTNTKSEISGGKSSKSWRRLGKKRIIRLINRIHILPKSKRTKKFEESNKNNNNNIRYISDDDDDDDENYFSAQEDFIDEKEEGDEEEIDVKKDDNELAYILPEELVDIPTFKYTKNCDQRLIDETRELLKERYVKNPGAFYDHDYTRMLTDDWTVTRFLLRRRLNPKQAAKLMEECSQFRQTYKMSEIQLSFFPIEFHKAGGLFGYAPDRAGNLTVYMRVRMYRRVPEISDLFKSWILCVIEQQDVANNGRGIAVIFDLSNSGLQNVDLSLLSWLLSSFRNYCPKGLSYIMVYNLPWILNATCKLALSWMSASNRRALRFVQGNEIDRFIAKENLPDYLGGDCKINYRAVPKGSKWAIDICEQLNVTREQAIKIKSIFKEFIGDDDEVVIEDDTTFREPQNGTKRSFVASSRPNQLVSETSKFSI